MNLRFGENLQRSEHFHIFLFQNGGQSVRCGAEIQQSPFFCGLLDPGVIIAVAVENDPLVGLDGLLDQVMERGLKIRHTLQPVGKFL